MSFNSGLPVKKAVDTKWSTQMELNMSVCKEKFDSKLSGKEKFDCGSIFFFKMRIDSKLSLTEEARAGFHKYFCTFNHGTFNNMCTPKSLNKNCQTYEVY